MKVASKIEPCPIIEAIMEIRFESKFEEGVVFGLVFNQLKNEYLKITNLPILEIPSSLRKRDPQLIYLPYYRVESITDNNKLVQIGPKVLSIIIKGNYPGWEVFKKEIQYGLQKLQESEVISSVSRFSLRYINFFDDNILSKSNLSILLGGKPLDSVNTVMRFELKDDNIINVLTMASSAQLKIESVVRKGATIDIDTVFNGPFDSFFYQRDEIMKKCHDAEKKLFFSLMSDDYESKLKDVVYA